MAKAYPRSTFVGFDYHQRSIDWARKAASDAGVSDRVHFEVAPADSFGGSVLLCVPNALSRQPKAVLGNQAGEARTRELTAAGGFTRFRRAAETPFELVYEVRP
jgi:hypothetical protein